jgi:hypothetical protein
MPSGPRLQRDHGICQEGWVRHQGLTVFALFFGISVLEALQGRHWIAVALWLGVGLFFVAMDRPRKTPNSTADRASPR